MTLSICPASALPFSISTRRRLALPSQISVVSGWASLCRQLPGTSLNALLFLGVLDYSPALAASTGSGKTTSPRRERLVAMKYGVTDEWRQSPCRISKPHLGPGKPCKRHVCLGVVSSQEILQERLQACDRLISCWTGSNVADGSWAF